MSFSITVPKAVAGESYYSGSVVARQAFTATVKALTSSGSTDTNYSGTVTLYANSSTDDKGYKIGTANLTKGVGTSTSLKITSVIGTGSGRKITAVDSSNNTGYINVGVWFKGDATNFTGNSQSYCGTPSGNYVALPAYGICKTDVAVYNPSTGKAASGKVMDIGPLFDANLCGSDAYWNTGTEPRSQAHKGEKRCELCGSDCSKDKVVINGAIIDLSPNFMTALGGTGTITNAYWRFS